MGKPLYVLFFKICERYIHNSVNPFVDKYLSVFISAYRKAYSANDVLIRFIENWKQSLDNHKYVGIARPIAYLFTKSFCATLNERDFSFYKCCATINVRNFFPIKSHSLQRDLRDFFCAQHFPRLRYSNLWSRGLVKSRDKLKTSLLPQCLCPPTLAGW